MRFRISKIQGVWVLMAVDPVAGYCPIMFAAEWRKVADEAGRVAANYALLLMERAESARVV